MEAQKVQTPKTETLDLNLISAPQEGQEIVFT